MTRRRSERRPAPREASRPAPARNSPPRPGMENDEILPNQVYASNQPIAPYDRVPTHCYHSSGDNEIRSIGGSEDFQIGSHLPWAISKDFQIGSIGTWKDFQLLMSQRADDARIFAKSQNFRSYERIYGHNNTFDMEERKIFISSGCNHLWQEKLYGITRVAVYAVDSICVVTRNKDVVQLDKDLALLWDTRYTMAEPLPYALISEVEDLACPPGESRRADSERSQKPFGVVSVIASTSEDPKASSDEFDEPKAIEYLREEMNNASTFTFLKTLKTATCALQHLFRKKFKPNEIRVFVWKSAWKREDYSARELKIHDERSIEDLLAVIKKQHIAGSHERFFNRG